MDLFITFDLFDPSPFGWPKDPAKAARAQQFIVVVPLVKSDALVAYFEAKPEDVRLQGLHDATQVAADYVPVPLLRGIDLEVREVLADQQTRISDFVAPKIAATAWKEFAEQNKLEVATRRLALLDESQRIAARAWALALADWLRSRAASSAVLDTLFKKYFTSYTGTDAQLQSLLDTPDFDVEQLVATRDDVYHPRPPRFVVSAGTPELALFDGFATYRDVVLANLRGKAKKDPEHLRQAVTQLFAFGERLWWPQPTDERAFMISDTKEGWAQTNAHSLLGLVWCLDENTKAVSLADKQGFVYERPAAAADPQPDAAVAEFRDEIAKLKQTPITVRMRPTAKPIDPASKPVEPAAAVNESTFVFHTHKAADAIEMRPVGDQKPWAVPASLLDLLDPRARVAMDKVTGEPGALEGSLRQIRPARRFLRKNDDLVPGSLPAGAELACRLIATLREIDLSGVDAAASSAYVLGFPELHPDDGVLLHDAFVEGKVELWLPPTAGRQASSEIVRLPAAGPLAKGGVRRIADRDNAIRKKLAVDPAKGTEIDVVIRGPDLPCFNVLLLAASADPPRLKLKDRFVTKVNRSIDRIVQDVRVSFENVDGPAYERLLSHSHAASHNKLHASLVGAAGSVPLTDGHVILPIKEDEKDASFCFPLAHELASDKELEGLRYYLTYHAGEDDWRIGGYLEHQYGTVLAAPASDDLAAFKLRLSTEVKNLADLAIGRPHDETAPAAGYPPFSALVIECSNGEVHVHCNRDYAVAALAHYDAPGSDDEDIAAIRAFYEALIELVRAKSAGLWCEGWRFDNSNYGVASTNDLVAACVPVGRTTVPLPNDLVRQMTDLVAIPTDPHSAFTGFVERLRSAVKQADGVGLWKRHPLAIAFPGASVARVSLDIVRDRERTIAADTFAESRCYPLVSKDSKDWTPYPKERGDAWRDFDGFVKNERSLLQSSASWLRTDDRPKSVDENGNAMWTSATERALDRLFGDVASRLFVLPKRPPLQTGKCFHVPFGFRPLAPYEALDMGLVEELVAFLANALDDIVDGRDRPMIASNESVDAALQAQDAAIAVAAELAPRFAKLVSIVENRSDAGRILAGSEAVVAGIREALPQLEAELTAMFANDPGLYARARGFGLVVFDTPRPPDRLFDVVITKRALRADAPAAAVVDSDRFAVSMLHRSGERRFFIDVLDDATYEDAYTVDRGTIARDGDELIRDVPPAPLCSLEMIPHNARWQREIDASRTLQYVGLIPSRRPPAVARVVSPGASAAGRQSSAFTAPRPESTVDVTDAANELAPRAGATEIAFQGEHLVGKPMAKRRHAQAELSAFAAGLRIDAFAVDHWFVFQTDDDGDDGMDAFDIEVTTSAPPEAASPPKGHPYPTDALWTWFQWTRSGPEKKEPPPPKPAPIAAGDAAAGIRSWLLKLLEPARNTEGGKAPTATYRKVGEEWTLQNNLANWTDVSEWQQRVLAVDVLDASTDDSGNPPVGGRRLLRVTTFGSPFVPTFVRIRLRRNDVDTNADGVPDIDRSFTMLSEYSGWSNPNTKRLRVDLADLAALPAGVGTLELQCSFDDMTANAIGASRCFARAMNEHWTARESTVYPQRHPFFSEKIWSHDLSIRGMVVQHLPYGQPDAGPAVLHSSIVRQHLGAAPATNADALDTMLARATKSDVRTKTPLVRLVWSGEHAPSGLDLVWPLYFSDQHES